MYERITNFSSGNMATEFIASRLVDDGYRGSWSSQHNRFTMERIVTILRIFNKYAPDQQLMKIRNTDIAKRPENTPDEYIYARFCDEAKDVTGIGSQDAMRKNLFVDLYRMGLIIRYDEKKKANDSSDSPRTRYVSLADQGLRLIKEETMLNRFFIFSKGVGKLLGGYIDIILNLLEDDEYDLEKISIHEFMFFVSAIGTDANFNIKMDKCVELIRAYRNLTSQQRKAFIELLKTILKPQNYKGDKTKKRDYHNWNNKVTQLYYLLGQTVYFEVRGDTLFLRTGKDSYAGGEQKRLNRSKSEKRLYFVNHNVGKKEGFELHHVVPLAWSESIQEFKLLDSWLNMVYIDGYSHAKITQNRNRNVVMSTSDEDMLLSDHGGKEVLLEKDKNIAYDIAKQSAMLDYNEELLCKPSQ